jgi:hypothetical protein
MRLVGFAFSEGIDGMSNFPYLDGFPYLPAGWSIADHAVKRPGQFFQHSPQIATAT